MLKIVTRNDLYSVPLPKNTPSYARVSNQELLSEIENQLELEGLQIKTENYTLFANGQRLVGYLGITGSDNPELDMMIGLRNSYDKSMSLGIAAGAQVMVCANGMVTGALTIARKHTGRVMESLSEMVSAAVTSLPAELQQAQIFQERSKNVQLSDMEIAHIMGELFYQEELLRVTQLMILRKEIKESRHFAMDSFDKCNVWNLYNNVTEALKRGDMHSLEQHQRVHHYFNDYVEEMHILTDTERSHNTAQNILPEITL